jgi:site-specific recombinase XerD
MAWTVEKFSGENKKVKTFYIYYRINGKVQKPIRTTKARVKDTLLKEAIDREEKARSGLKVETPIEKISWQEFKKQYLDFVLNRKRLSLHTHARILEFIKVFERIAPPSNIDCFNYSTIEKFIKTRSNEVSENTVDREITIIKAMTRFAHDSGYLMENIGNKVKKYNTYKGRTKDFLILEDISRAISLSTGSLHTAILFAWNTGLRREELTFVDIWKDINVKLCKLHVHAKPGLGFNIKDHENRTIPYDPSLNPYIEQLRKESKSQWLIRNENGERMRPDSLTHSAAKFFTKHNFSTVINKHTPSLHSIRHSYGTYLLHGGATLQEVKALMGHAKISTTEIYLHTADEYLKTAVTKLPKLPQLPSVSA